MLTKSNFSGCILGQCVGDAVGMPVERHSLAECQEYARRLSNGSGIGCIEHEMFTFGQYTDDSQLMRELLISFVACEDFDPADYARRIAKIHTARQIIGSSSASKKVAARLNEGISWKKAGTPAPYARNGSAMRSAPIGLFFCDDIDKLIQAACDQGRITHQDPRSLAGAVAISGAVAIAVQVEEIAIPQFLTQLSEWVGRVDTEMAEYVRNLAKWIDLPLDAALQEIIPLGEPPSSLDDWEGITPWIVPSVLWSLYAFLSSPNDYWRTICTAIAGGGDTDTTAAMAGAISGAFLGLEAVPEKVSHQLTDRGKWGYEPLLSLSVLGFHAARVRQLSEEESLVTRWAAELA